MRVVVDTSVIVAAVRSDRGICRLLLEAALEQRFTLLLSVPLLIEYEAVLLRPTHLKAAGISSADVYVLLDALALVATPVRLAFLWRPTLRDSGDDMVLETALNGVADWLVTANLRDFVNASAQFELNVLSPGQAWRKLLM